MLQKSLVRLTGLIILLAAARVSAQGTVIPWAGPVNAGMAGAATAAPLDAIGATYWNPATTSALTNELSVGVGLLVPLLDTRSSVTGLGSGTTNSETGASVLPSIGFVHRAEGSPLTLSLGVLPVAGFGSNYPASTTNPFFTPQSNAPGAPGGFGRLFTRAMFLQIAPSITMALDDKLSVSVGPTITAGEIVVDPFVFGPLNDADGSTQPRYGSGRGTRLGWGGGVQLGVYYIADNCWHYGASIKSPQWMEDFRVQSEDELGRPTVHRLKADLPMIISLGTAYRGFEDIVFALDVRYFDYKNADGHGTSGFAADGRLLGLGMSNMFSLAAGVQLRMTDTLYVRGGYNFNSAGFTDAEATINVAVPVYYQHIVNVGASLALSETCWINAAYSIIPHHETTGPIVTPAGPIPGGSVTTDEVVHTGHVGITVKY